MKRRRCFHILKPLGEDKRVGRCGSLTQSFGSSEMTSPPECVPLFSSVNPPPHCSPVHICHFIIYIAFFFQLCMYLMITWLDYQNIQLASKCRGHILHQLLPFLPMTDIADGASDIEPSILPLFQTLTQLRLVPSTSVHASPKPGQLFQHSSPTYIQPQQNMTWYMPGSGLHEKLHRKAKCGSKESFSKVWSIPNSFGSPSDQSSCSLQAPSLPCLCHFLV